MTTLEFSPLATQPPPPPSKWDIIPIHNSDRASFKFCRRQWVWSSPSHRNLIPRATVYGVEKNLWFGTGIHYALERYYNPSLREDPAVAFDTWFNLQWRGGIVSEDEVSQFVDRNPQRLITYGDHTPDVPVHYKVDGLIDILPDTYLNEELFEGMHDMGIGMMNFYKDYSAANDNFTVISVEHNFSVPVLNEKGEPLYMVDTRKMPEGWEPDFDTGNDFGPLMRMTELPSYDGKTVLGRPIESSDIEKQVHTRGKTDLIIRENTYGRYGIMDHKTASTIGDDYFRHLELDEQCTSYLAFGELEARIHNLEYQDLEFITYQALLKGYPKPPTILKSGLPSLSKTTETTTPALFEKYIKDNGLQIVFDSDQKMQSYYAWLLETGDKRFVQRTDTWRNKTQRRNAMVRLYYEAQDMLSGPVPYPSPSKNYMCLNCRFRIPCIQAETGDDFNATLEDGYISNWDR